MAPSIKEPAEESRPPSPSEVTTLLPQSSTSRPHTPKLYGGHGRKPSVAASVRGSGPAVNRPSPTQQVARVSKRGQRRILTTPLLRTLFFALVIGTFLSLVLTLVLFINTATDLSSVLLPTRGSGFAEFWMAFMGAWMGVGGVIFFSHPSLLFFFTTFLSLILLFPILLISLLSPGLKRIHNPLLLLPLLLTLFTGILTLLSSYLVRRARTKESRRVVRMVTDGVGHGQAVRDEAVARALVGMDKRKWYHKVLGFFGGVFGFIAGLATLLLVTLLLVNMSLEAYDFATPLPSPHSQLVSVKPSGASTAYNIHLACVPPGNDTHHRRSFDFTPSFSSQKTSNLPTVIYEPPSGVPGSLSLLHAPLPPSGESAHLPGKWLFKLQDEGKVGMICVWDRPGYGYSEIATDSDIGSINHALWLGLEKVLSKKQLDLGFVLVGEGYGGILSRVFASQHPSHIKGLVHIEAQTAQTYFNENPRNLSTFRLFIHRIATRLFPSLLTPLGLPSRLPSVIFRRSTSESRVLASVYPKPDTSRLNQRLQKARLQETFASHSHISHSFRTLLDSERHYPGTAPAVVLSSRHHMDTDEDWKQGQRGLWEEVTSEEGRKAGEWVVLKGDVGGRHVCESQEGAKACARAVQKVLKA